MAAILIDTEKETCSKKVCVCVRVKQTVGKKVIISWWPSGLNVYGNMSSILTVPGKVE